MDIMEVIRGLSLPPGFGFRPTEVELFGLLQKKIQGLPIEHDIISELDIYKYDPWDLSAMSHPLLLLSCSDSDTNTNPILHFFTPRGRKYPKGFRANRCTQAGYWKITGAARTIEHRNRKLCIKKTLVFHLGRPRPGSGTATEWIMHEYSLHQDQCQDAPHLKDLFVLCRVTKRDASSSNANHSEVLPVPNQIGADQLTLATVHSDRLMPNNSLTLAETLVESGNTSVDQLGADQLTPATIHPDLLMPDNSSTLEETLTDGSNTGYNKQCKDSENWLPHLIDLDFTATSIPTPVGPTPLAPIPERRICPPCEGFEDENSFLFPEDIQSIFGMPVREGCEDENSFMLPEDIQSILGMPDHQNTQNLWFLEDETACTSSALDINLVSSSNEDKGKGIVRCGKRLDSG